MNGTSPNSQHSSDDFITYGDGNFLVMLNKSKWLILIVIAICVAASIFYRLRSDDIFEAKGEIYLATVGGAPVVPVDLFVMRIDSAQFKSDILSELGLDPTSASATLYKKSLNVRRSDNKIALTVRGYSANEASKLIDHTTRAIIREQDSLASTEIERLNATAENIRTEIVTNQATLDSFKKILPRLQSECGKESRFNSACISTMLLHIHLKDTATDLRISNAAIRELELKLSPSQTHLSASIYDDPLRAASLTPTIRHVVALAVFVGLVAGICLAVGFDMLQRLRK